MEQEQQGSGYEGWAIVELMGHQRVAGRISDAVIAGAAMLRIDIHRGEKKVTQFLGGASIYRITPTTEDVARRAAMSIHTQAPVSPWELRALPQTTTSQGDTDNGEGDPDDPGVTDDNEEF